MFKFPDLFSYSIQKNEMVGEIVRMDNMYLVWNLKWRILFFLGEDFVFENILSMLRDFILSLGRGISGFGGILKLVF